MADYLYDHQKIKAAIYCSSDEREFWKTLYFVVILKVKVSWH